MGNNRGRFNTKRKLFIKMRDIKIKKGFAENYKGEVITKGTDLLAGDCHCGIDCCYGYIRLPNYNSLSGDTETYAMYLVDGEWVIEPEADAIAAIKAFKTNSLVSATSVSITGCPEADVTTTDPIQLTATVLPTGSLQTGTWASSTPATATVNSSGLVTPVADGTTNITFTTTDGGFVATCAITVALV